MELVSRRAAVTVALAVSLMLGLTAAPTSAAVHPDDYLVKQRDIMIASDSPGVGGGSVGCGTGRRVVSGGAFLGLGAGPDSSVTAYLTNSSPTLDGKRWYAAAINWDGVPVVLRIVAYCLPISATGALTITSRTVTVATNGTVSRNPQCPSGTRVLVGGGFWHLPDQGPDPELEGYLRASAPDSDAKGWWVAGLNDDSEMHFTVVALCLPSGSFPAYTIRSVDIPVADDGHDSAIRACPAGKATTGGGAYWHLEGEGRDASLQGYLRGSAPRSGGARWVGVGANLADDELRLRVIALCLPA